MAVKKKSKKLSEQLVLNKFFLSLFNAKDFGKDFEYLKGERLEGYNQDKGCSNFILEILNRNVSKIPKDLLLIYDENIKKHTSIINQKRDIKIKWKYFQYLSILFVEIYLDWYFRDPIGLKDELNVYLNQFNLENNVELQKFDLNDLKKIALWNATGSGKTLILHINILQYRYYIYHYHKERYLNKIIILTPNEGLSKQHLEELKKSSIKAELFSDEINLFNMDTKEVSIIDLHKIRRTKGDKTVALDAFETNNFVLIDEGHIGLSSNGSSDLSWNEIRNTISQDGFCIEYSATFEQAISSKGKNNELEEYSKSILFDYSYKYFYRDGYGKDYRILNMASIEESDNNKFKYLVGALLNFYQQLKLYRTGQFTEFNIHEPLMIFVGSKVNAVRTLKNSKVSDVVDILLFINRFIENNNNEAINVIENILKGNSGLYSKDKDLFLNKLPYVNQLYLNSSAEEIYKDMFKEIFNYNSIGGSLRIENLKSCNGEIALSVGENSPFGVINVGDTNELIKLCEVNNLKTVSNDFQASLFNNIKDKDSSVKILIGSKKFTEGWDCWRVSTIGLMNMGKNEGSQIIQLFGRGVRLQGFNLSLKRTAALGPISIGTAIPQYISILETLNIFGINADYMQAFREMLLREDVPINDEKVDLDLPILQTIEGNELKKLKVIKVKDNLHYKKDAEKEILNDEVTDYFKKNKIVIDLYKNIEQVQSEKEIGIGNLIKQSVWFTEEIIFIIDIDRVYFELTNYKKEKCLYNINIYKNKLISLLLDSSWYEILIPKVEFDFNFQNKTKYEDIAILLLKKYLDKFYRKRKADWEKDKLEYVELSYEDFVKNDTYHLEIDISENTVIQNISKLKDTLNNYRMSGKIKSILFDKYSNSNIKFIGFDRHIYNPLVALPSKVKNIKVSPVALNEGESKFVEDLKKYVENKKNDSLINKEVYLLRNSIGNVGFFEEGNFYPDFIMWIIDISNNKQYISFIDPKGMRNVGLKSEKVMLHKKIKEYEKIINKNSLDNSIILNSFILSVTSIDELKMLYNGITLDSCEANNVFFIDTNNYIDRLINKVIFKEEVEIKEIITDISKSEQKL